MLPLVKNIKRYFSLRELAIIILAAAFSVSAGIGTFLYMRKEVVINDNGSYVTVGTMKTTVGEVLDQSGIQVAPEDYISLPLETELSRDGENTIHIRRAVPVNIMVDGEEINVMSYRETVKEVLEDNSIMMSEADRLDSMVPKDRVIGGMTIRVIRVNEKMESENIPLPYTVVKQENNRMDKGTEKVVREGKEGVREKVFKVVYEDGIEVARSLMSDTNVQNPVSKLIEYGTVLNFKTSRGDTVRYKKVLDMKATSYTSSFEDTGKNPGHPQFGITYTGAKAKRGIIAVDPKVIPLGTRVYVEGVGNTPDYGFAVAADIGGAIKGKLIDLYFEDSETVRNWGRKNVRVYILQ